MMNLQCIGLEKLVLAVISNCLMEQLDNGLCRAKWGVHVQSPQHRRSRQPHPCHQGTLRLSRAISDGDWTTGPDFYGILGLSIETYTLKVIHFD